MVPAKGPPHRQQHQKDPTRSVQKEVPPAVASESEFANLHQKIQAEFDSLRKQKRPARKKDAEPSKPAQLTESGRRKRKGKDEGKKKGIGGEVKQNAEHAVESTLEQEVLSLGGTADDLKLLEDAASGSEVEGVAADSVKQKSQSTNTDGLQKGLANILKEIALATGDTGPPEVAETADSESQGEQQLLNLTKANPRATDPRSNASLRDTKNRKTPASKLLCEARPDWYNTAPPTINDSDAPQHALSSKYLDELQSHAKSLLDKDNETFKQQTQSSSSHTFYNTVINSGTLSDRISALTLAVQESPVHNMRALENLIGLAKKRSRAQAVDVLRAIKDLFAQGSLLPDERRLHTFAANPVMLAAFSKVKSWKSGDNLPKGVTDGHLVIWVFESWLKQQYFEVLQTLENWCNDEIEFSKSRAISYIYELLKEKPEQEANLLRLLVNKLGDRIKKIASQTSYQIMQLLVAHPAMKLTVLSAVESDFIFRPGQSLHAKYYAVVTLNQTVLSSQEADVASKLLDIYFGLFVGLLKPEQEPEPSQQFDGMSRGRQRRMKQKKQRGATEKENGQEIELKERLISAILTGINRAYPFSEKEGHGLESHLDTLFKVTHSSNFNTSIQAMMLIQQLTTSHPAAADRFYRALYESLLDPRLVTSSKQQLYLNLLHRSLKADLSVKRVKAFSKRILQILSLHEPSFTCGAFFLLADLQKSFPSLEALMDQPEDHENEEEHFQDHDEDAITPATTAPQAATKSNDHYDPRKRDPIHANADTSCAWDVLPYLAHFHPSVLLSADHLLSSRPLPGKPDLSLHTLSHFLDRFVYRNPKLSTSGLKGHSIMQPIIASDNSDGVLINSAAKRRETPLNSETFRLKPEDMVAPDEAFFHKYFSTLGKETATDKKVKRNKRKRAGSEGSEDDIGSQDEDEVWKAMVDSAPQLEGADEGDDDISLGDLESEMDYSDSEDAGSDAGGVEVDFDLEGDEMADVSDSLPPADQADVFMDGVPDLDTDEDESEVEIPPPPSKKTRHAKGTDALTGADKTSVSKLMPETKKADRRKKLKSLPTFASVADYAEMIDDDGDEDMG